VPDYEEQSWDYGDTFRAEDASEMSREINEEETINQAQQAEIDALETDNADDVEWSDLALMQAVSPAAYEAGQHYHCNSVGSGSTANTLGFSNLRLSAWIVPRTLPLAALGVETTVVGDATATFKIGLYALGIGTRPGALLFEGVSLPMDAAVGFQFDETADLVLTPGLYWVGGALQGSGAQPTMRTVNQLGTPQIQLPLGTSGLVAASVVNQWARGATTGAFPNPAAQFGVSGVAPPRVTFRVAA
jgi:hypothetical protein